MNKRKTLLILSWVVLVLMTTTLFIYAKLTSDLLFLDAIMDDVFNHGGRWQYWKLTPAPAYFPDILAYAVGYLIFPYPAMRVDFVCTVQVLLLAWACVRLATAINPSFSVGAKIAVLLVLCFVVLVAANSGVWLFFNSTNNHFASLLFPILCASFFLNYWDLNNKRNVIFIFLCAAAGMASTPVFAISFIAPFLLFSFIVCFIFRSFRVLRLFIIRSSLIVLAGSLAGWAGHNIITPFDAFEGRAPGGVDAAFNSFVMLFHAFRHTFSTDNLFSFSLVLFAVGCVFWSIFYFIIRLEPRFNKIKDSSAYSAVFFISELRYSAALIFALISVPVVLGLSVASGGISDIYAFRYFSFPIALFMLLAIVALDRFKNIGGTHFSFAMLFFLLALMVLCIKNVKDLSAAGGGWEVVKHGVSAGNQHLEYLDGIARCVDKEYENGFSFNGGVADFWYARGLKYRTEKPAYMLQTLNDLTPFFHMMSIEPLLDPNKYGVSLYNFVVVRNERGGGGDAFNFYRENISEVAPSPARIVNCENTDAELWLYEDSGLDDVIKKKSSLFLFGNGNKDEHIFIPADLPGNIGGIKSEIRVVDEADGFSPDLLSYGPYTNIHPGNYKLTISYAATGNGNRWDAGVFGGDEASRFLIASGDFLPELKVIESNFEIKDFTRGFEIRTWYGGEGSFALQSIKIERFN